MDFIKKNFGALILLTVTMVLIGERGNALPQDQLQLAYQIIGIQTQNPTWDNIKAAYKAAIKREHPDKVQDATAKQSATKKFQDIKTAYDILNHEFNPRNEIYYPQDDGIVGAWNNICSENNLNTAQRGPNSSWEDELFERARERRAEYERADRKEWDYEQARRAEYERQTVVIIATALTTLSACAIYLISAKLIHAARIRSANKSLEPILTQGQIRQITKWYKNSKTQTYLPEFLKTLLHIPSVGNKTIISQILLEAFLGEQKGLQNEDIKKMFSALLHSDTVACDNILKPYHLSFEQLMKNKDFATVVAFIRTT